METLLLFKCVFELTYRLTQGCVSCLLINGIACISCKQL
ncbi:MAG: hypothetical protein HRU40_01515 [Saprospiraceae bacterium]|nr:hypothetical protein [Saprospiraceae bacterium]